MNDRLSSATCFSSGVEVSEAINMSIIGYSAEIYNLFKARSMSLLEVITKIKNY